MLRGKERKKEQIYRVEVNEEDNFLEYLLCLLLTLNTVGTNVYMIFS